MEDDKLKSVCMDSYFFNITFYLMRKHYLLQFKFRRLFWKFSYSCPGNNNNDFRVVAQNKAIQISSQMI